MKIRTFALYTFLVVASASMLTGCGAINFVKSAQISSSAQNGSQYGELSVDLNTSALQFPTISVPFPDGSVALATGSTGAQLDITVNLTALAQLPAGTSSALLPNGAALPISGFSSSSLLTYNVGSSEVYVDFDTTTKQAMFGTALVISEFNIGTNADLFIPFTSGGVSGVAGVFTSSQTGESGFAVFADVSSLIPPLTVTPNVTSLHALALQGPITSSASRNSSNGSHYSFSKVSPSSSSMNKLNNMLNTLNRKKTPLHVE